MGHQTAEAHSSSLVLGCAARNSSGSQTSSTRSLGSPPRLRVTPTETVCKNVQPEVCSLPPFPHLAFPNLSSSPEPCRKAFIISIQCPVPAPLSNKRVQTRKQARAHALREAHVLDDVHEKYRFQGQGEELANESSARFAQKKKKRKTRGG